MNESKINLTTRLRREGRWDEASKFKDETLKKLRGEGMKKAEAGEEAWKRMAAQYPPLAPDVEAMPATAQAVPEKPSTAQSPSGIKSDVEIDALLDRIGDGRPSDLVQDTLWAYENLANSRIKASDAPSCGAWALLEWARQYRNRFFEQVLPKAMTNKPPQREERNRLVDKSVADIRKVLESLNDRWLEKLAADVPKNVKDKVRSTLEEWAKQFALTIPSEAKTYLEATFSRLAQDCVDAVAPKSRGV